MAVPNLLLYPWLDAVNKRLAGDFSTTKACEGNHHKPSYYSWIVYETVFTVEGRKALCIMYVQFFLQLHHLCCVLSNSEYFEYTFDVFMWQFTW